MQLSDIQAEAMLELQSDMNAKVNPQWLTAGYPFLRAVVVEGAEGMEHKGWKWWKAQDANMPQLCIELVDIWHFILSDYLIHARGDVAKARSTVIAELVYHQPSIEFDGRFYHFEKMDLIEMLELTIGLSVSRRVSLPLFECMLDACGMSWNDLYRQYIAKNVLNFFRQDNGYKQGTYRKVWHGREDNEHLHDLIMGLDASDPGFKDAIYAGLQARYQSSTKE